MQNPSQGRQRIIDRGRVEQSECQLVNATKNRIVIPRVLDDFGQFDLETSILVAQQFDLPGDEGHGVATLMWYFQDLQQIRMVLKEIGMLPQIRDDIRHTEKIGRLLRLI
jgi:hypothetical protein